MKKDTNQHHYQKPNNYNFMHGIKPKLYKRLPRKKKKEFIKRHGRIHKQYLAGNITFASIKIKFKNTELGGFAKEIIKKYSDKPVNKKYYTSI